MSLIFFIRIPFFSINLIFLNQSLKGLEIYHIIAEVNLT